MKSGKSFAVNRKARFNYEILETYEAGIVLLGTEIKAIREGRASISEAYARPDDGEMWLLNAHIAQYSAGGLNNHDPIRPRKLLLRKKELDNLSRNVSERGLTVVPLRLYLKRHLAKLQLGLAKGRTRYDKRRALMEKERIKEARQAMGRFTLRV